MARTKAGIRGKGPLVLAGVLGFLAGCASVPPARPAAAQPAATATSPIAVPSAPGFYPGTAQTAGYPGPTPPAAYPSGDPPASYPGASPPGTYPSPGYPSVGMAPPPTSGVVPIGATGIGPAGRDVVPVVALDAPPTSPGPPTSAADPGTPLISAPRPQDTPNTAKPGDDNSGFEWSKLAPENVWKDMKKAAGYGPDEKIARTEFQAAEALFREKKYAEAAPKFYTASWRWPDSVLEEDALFLLGECYFFADQYSKAHDAYANLLKKHENTRYLDTVMTREFAIGRFWEQLDVKSSHWPTTPNLTDKTRPLFDTFGNALAAYEAVRLHDPTGPLAADAVMATANAYFRKGRWEDAAYHYDILRKDYPKSQFQQQAYVLGAQARWRIYQGKYYDAGPLNDTSDIVNQALTQFRGRLGEEEPRMLEMRARLLAEKAERELAMAQYYDNKKYYGAARQYYRSLIEQYSTTPAAQQARKRLDEIKNEPDSPPNHFVWLTRLFERER
jgi:TolA-binding protein